LPAGISDSFELSLQPVEMESVFSKDGTRIAYNRSGQGPALILIDGAFCSRTFGPMPKLSPLLTANFTVFAYDRRGRGDSTDTAPYSVEREVEDLDALIQVAGGSAYVFGMSSGAVLALHAAASGLNITKIAIYEPPFMIGNGKPVPDHYAELTKLIAADRRGDAVKYYLVKVIGMPAIFFYIMRLLPMWTKMKAIANSLPYDAAVMGDFTLPVTRIRAVKVPVLVIGGEKSPAILIKSIQAVTETLPDANSAMLKGQNHNVSVKVLAPELLNFF
jgi:pimeloyl-ACP methyl ester carboxylesterase